MKKLVALTLLAVFTVSSGIVATAAGKIEAGKTVPEKPGTEISINVNLKNEEFCFGEIKPIIRNGRTLVPLQCGIFERFSATTEYDHIYKEIVIRTDSHVLTLYTDRLVIYNKGERCYELDVHAEYIDGQVYVPLRGFMESMGRKVRYDGETNTAQIW
jgi:hypothetical protein